MITFNSLIYQVDGEFFRFQRQDDQVLACHSCQWHGGVLPDEANPKMFKAFVEQKYPPYGRIWCDEPLPSENAGMKWVALELLKE